jgi:hypothetical protein
MWTFKKNPSLLFSPLRNMGPTHAQLSPNSIKEMLSTSFQLQLGNLVSKVGKPRDKDDVLYNLTKQL